MRRPSPPLFWLGVIGVPLALLWLIRPVLLPFLAGTVIAYFLDPLADWLERRRFSRGLAAATVLLGFAVVFVTALVLLVPLLQSQLDQLIAALPQIADWSRRTVLAEAQHLLHRLPPQEVEQLRSAAGEWVGTLIGWIVGMLRSIVTSSFALFDVVSLVFVTPIVAFYLLRDWDRMIQCIDAWLPRHQVVVIRQQMGAIDHTLSGFLRGQATVCVALGLFYACGLTVAGLNFGLVIGLLAGFLSFIPFLGTAFGFVASTGIALFQFETWTQVAVVIGVFLIGQILEGNVLTPKLVGDRVGLHPVWVMLAVLAGGSLFGFLGVLIAVPVAAVIGVVVRFWLHRYLRSFYYLGVTPPELPSTPARLILPDDRGEP